MLPYITPGINETKSRKDADILTSDIPSYDILGLNVKITKKPLSTYILYQDSGHKETLPPT